MKEVVFIPLSELFLDVAQELVDVGQLKYLLITNNEDQLEFIVQLKRKKKPTINKQVPVGTKMRQSDFL